MHSSSKRKVYMGQSVARLTTYSRRPRRGTAVLQMGSSLDDMVQSHATDAMLLAHRALPRMAQHHQHRRHHHLHHSHHYHHHRSEDEAVGRIQRQIHTNFEKYANKLTKREDFTVPYGHREQPTSFVDNALMDDSSPSTSIAGQDLSALSIGEITPPQSRARSVSIRVPNPSAANGSPQPWSPPFLRQDSFTIRSNAEQRQTIVIAAAAATTQAILMRKRYMPSPPPPGAAAGAAATAAAGSADANYGNGSLFSTQGQRAQQVPTGRSLRRLRRHLSMPQNRRLQRSNNNNNNNNTILSARRKSASRIYPASMTSSPLLPSEDGMMMIR